MVRLVEYPESSDDEGSQWSEVLEAPASPCDSFSYPMREEEEDGGEVEGEEDADETEDDEDGIHSETREREEEREEDDDDDEDYAPSEVDSATSSVDTDDLDPDNEMDEELPERHDENVSRSLDEEGELEEKVIDLTQTEEDQEQEQEEKRGVFYAWKDLQEAFEDNPFKRRSMDMRDEDEEGEAGGHEEEEEDVEDKEETDDDDEEEEERLHAEKEGEEHVAPDGQQEFRQHEQKETQAPNFFDVEAGQWGFQAAFTPGVGDKKKTPRRRRPTPTVQHRPTGVSPRFSALFTGEQRSTTARDAATDFTMHQSLSAQEKPSREGPVAAGQKTNAASSFPPPQVEIPAFAFTAKQSNAPKASEFTFGKMASATFDEAGDDIHMRSPTPRHTQAAPFAATDGGFSLGRSGKAPKPYSFAGHGVSATSKPSTSRPKPSNTAKGAGNGDDTHMRSPSPPANRTPTNAEFLFGQGYKNRKPFAWGRQSSSESLNSSGQCSAAATTAAPGQAAGSSWAAKTSSGGSSSGTFGSSGPTAASAFFSPGVAGPTRNADRRKKKVAFAPQASSIPSASPFQTASASAASFGSSLFQEATATRQRSENPFAPFGGSSFQAGDKVYENGAAQMPSAVPSFAFGNSNGKPFQTVDPSPSPNGAFGSTTAAANSGTVLFGNGTSHHPFEFGEADTPQTQSEAASGFQMGSAQKNSRRNPRVRPRKSGMFAKKNSPRKDAKLGATEPEPSPGASSSSPATPSPFGMHNHRSRKNARLRRTYGRSPPADPFATTTFQSHPPSSTFGSSDQPNVVRPTAKKGLASAFAGPNSVHFGPSTAQQQKKTSNTQTSGTQSHSSSHSFIFPTAEPSHSGKSEQGNVGGVRPGFAGSRRILRAALRGAGVQAERAKSAPPTISTATTQFHRDEGDDEMDSEDERDWLELKRLGGVAHGSRHFEDAAEYYRQSIEVLESHIYHDPLLDTPELRTDKAKLHANRAASLMMLMQITDAQRECQRSIEVDATYARAYLRLGRIQVLLGDTVHAQANLDTAKQLMQGNSELSTSDQADLTSLTKMEATIKKLTTLQGEIKWYVDCGDFKQALVHTESALGLAPSSKKLQVQKVRILLHQKEFDQIVQFCASIVEKQQASHGKQSGPETRGMNSRSLKEKTVENITIVGIDLGLLWATTLHYQNKVEEAVRILSALEAVAPCSSNVIQLKRQWQEMKQLKHNGNERFKRGEYQEAVRFYSEAVQIDPQHHEFCAIIYCNRAAAQMGLERYHTAILDCNEALQRKPQYPRALLRRARCHVALKMFHEAVKDFDRYLREQPNDLPTEATAEVRRERNEAKAAIAKAREEARQREAAKKRAEREQRQRRSNRWEESSWSDNRYYDNFRRTSSSSSSSSSNNNGSSYGSSRYQSSGANSRASFMAPKTQRRTHYDVLGIEKSATNDQIKKAYRKLALVYHPDKAKTSTHADLFKEMTAAYTVLSDESARAKYDRELIYNRFGNFYES